jgi:hypothetical protein
MIDLQLDDDMDLVFGLHGDLETLTGRRLVEQQLLTLTLDYFNSIIGEHDPEVIERRVQLQADRIARDLGVDALLADLRIEAVSSDSILVELIYVDGEETSATL